MAVRFNLDKFKQVKQSYIEYLNSGKFSVDMVQLFAAYKQYLDVDEEVRNLQKSIKSRQEAEKRRAEEIKKSRKLETIKPQPQTKPVQALTPKKAKKKAVAAPVKKASPTPEIYVPITERYRGRYNPELEAARRQVILERISRYKMPCLTNTRAKILGIHTSHDFSNIVNISFLKSIKDVSEFRLLKSLVERLFHDQSKTKEDWLQRLNQRINLLNTKVLCAHGILKYEPIRATIIYTPMGGMNKHY